MKKIHFIIAGTILGLICAAVTVYSSEEPDFSLLQKGRKVSSPPGIFDTGKAEFKPSLANYLNKLGSFLKNNPGMVIEIGGHADNSGSAMTNKRISLARANKTKSYLVERIGIRAERIVTRGYSATYPLMDNSTPTGRATNRRIEIILLKNYDPAGRLTYIRRKVLTKPAADIDFSPAILNQGLFHLDRVLTRDSSNANVKFQDLSNINLAPQSLMIMYSQLEKGLRLAYKQNIRLMTGGLRTKLRKLKGGLKVETPSAVINSDSIEILVNVDKKEKSSLSVFDGNSKIAAQGKEVDVPAGYGTVVEKDKEPAPPEPLPPAPEIRSPGDKDFYIPHGGETKTLEFSWTGAEDKYHLQVALDDEFVEIIEDRILNDRRESLTLGAGLYFWRVSAINRSGLEGFAKEASIKIVVQEEQPEMPFSISPGPSELIELTGSSLQISGKAVAGAIVKANGISLEIGPGGYFSGSVALKKGWDYIMITATHSKYKKKKVWLTVNYRDLCSPAWTFAGRYDMVLDDQNLKNSIAPQIGRIFCLSPRLEGELSLGLNRFHFKNSPGDYKNKVITIPMTAELRYILGGAKLSPFLSMGFTSYLAFPENRLTGSSQAKVFMSPELGGGLSFPITGNTTRLEIKYAPLLKNEPFFQEMIQRISLILKVLF